MILRLAFALSNVAFSAPVSIEIAKTVAFNQSCMIYPEGNRTSQSWKIKLSLP